MPRTVHPAVLFREVILGLLILGLIWTEKKRKDEESKQSLTLTCPRPLNIHNPKGFFTLQGRQPETFPFMSYPRPASPMKVRKADTASNWFVKLGPVVGIISAGQSQLQEIHSQFLYRCLL